MEQSKTPEKYQHVRLPYEPFRVAGKRLVLRPGTMETADRFCLWRLEEQNEDEGSGIMLFRGPPGTGKSVFARSTADHAVRHTGGRGNALIVQTSALFSEELGRSAKLIAELFQAVECSASRFVTVVIWDDAEGIFVSREQVIAARDPTDLLRVTTTLNAGFDRLCGLNNVLHIVTGNFTDVLDPAIMDRIDHVVSFGLPSFAERLDIIRGRLNGQGSEELVGTLAAATEGWSGRRLAKLVMQAFLSSTVRTRQDLTAADFLRAVGVSPVNGAVVSNGNGTHQPQPEGAAAMEPTQKEDAACQNGQSGSPNESPQQSLPRPTRWRWRPPWFRRSAACPSVPQPALSE